MSPQHTRSLQTFNAKGQATLAHPAEAPSLQLIKRFFPERPCCAPGQPSELTHSLGSAQLRWLLRALGAQRMGQGRATGWTHPRPGGLLRCPPDHHHHDSPVRVPRLEQNPQGQAPRAHSTKTCECFISVSNYGTCESPVVSNRLSLVSQSAAVSLRHPQDRASTRLPESGMQGCWLSTPLDGRSQVSWQRRPDPLGAGITLPPCVPESRGGWRAFFFTFAISYLLL